MKNKHAMKKKFLVLLNIGIAMNLMAQDFKGKYPTTKKVNQVDNFFGVNVNDPYRWLEDDLSTDTKNWVETQNKVTFEYLDQIKFREKLKNQLTDLWNYEKYLPLSKR